MHHRVFRNILRKILISFQKAGQTDEQSLQSRKSMRSRASAFQGSLAWESLAGRSISQSTQNLSASDSVEIFHRICEALNMKPSFVDYAIHELLGVELADKSFAPISHRSIPSPEEMASFLALAFRLCTRDSNLVIVALDDLHYADEFSWMVIQHLFTKETNILIIGALNTASIEDLRVDSEFWTDLNGKYRDEDRFTIMKLGHLNRDEITHMIMKTLGIRRKEVLDDVLDGVTIQSGGMPHFVNEILEQVKRQMSTDEDFEFADMTFDSFADLVLQRLDSFDFNTRNVLNIGAVIGLSFTLDELVGVEIRTSDGSVEAVRQITKESLLAAVEEGILETKTIFDDDSDEGEVQKFAFCHAVWRITLLTLMLEGRKRDLHRVIAETLEEMDVESNNYMFQTKLFKHWVSSGNFVKASKLALTVGRHFEERLGLPAQSIRIYNEALDLLREPGEQGPRNISGDALANITADDLVYLIRVHVALGHALSIAQQMKESVATYQDALRITQTAKSAPHLKDRSILFPVFAGLSIALKNGYVVQDAELKYEKAMLRRYTQETRLYGDPIYIIHALSLQADMYSRLGEFATAIEAQKGVSQIYDVEFFSIDLCDQYGSDIAAECLARSALWHLQLDNASEALSICRYVTRDILSRIERRNVHATFMVLYPILWVLVECGCASEARESFEMFVCQPFTELPQGMTTYFLCLYEPILMLLDLRGNTDIDEAIIDDYVEWATEMEHLTCGDLINLKTADMGRSGDSIAAEICYLLAQRAPKESDRRIMIENGKRVATDDVRFVQEKCIVLAGHCSVNLLNNVATYQT
jgi:tetratricopeptide (TPR) repeat protein